MEFTWSERNPDLPEPKVTGNRGSMTDVEIKSNGAVLKFSFDSWEEAQAFIDAYANAYSIMGSWEGLARRRWECNVNLARQNLSR